MDPIQQIPMIDAAVLTPVIRRATGHPGLVLGDWTIGRLNHFAVNDATGGIFRVVGTAEGESGPATWSVVLKIARPGEPDEHPSFWNYGKREFFAYQSGLLDDLPGALTAPRCFGVEERSATELWIWLEEIVQHSDERWTLDRYGVAARHFGQFNGAYLTGRALPRHPWLSAGMRSIVEPGGWWATYMDPRCPGSAWEWPIVHTTFPRPLLDEVLQIWRERAMFLDALARLPQVLCHGDSHRRNLLTRLAPDGHEQMVALDWAFLGVAAVGVELATLIGTTLFYCDVEPTRAEELEQVVYDGYLAGLTDAGWQGDERQVRLGYTAAMTIGPGASMPGWLTYMLDDANVEASTKQYGRSAEAIGAAFVSLTEFAHSCHAEARGLMKTL